MFLSQTMVIGVEVRQVLRENSKKNLNSDPLMLWNLTRWHADHKIIPPAYSMTPDHKSTDIKHFVKLPQYARTRPISARWAATDPVGARRGLLTGPRLNIKTVFPRYIAIPVLKIRRSRDRLVFNMGIPILVRRHLYIETAQRFRFLSKHYISVPCIILYDLRSLYLSIYK